MTEQKNQSVSDSQETGRFEVSLKMLACFFSGFTLIAILLVVFAYVIPAVQQGTLVPGSNRTPPPQEAPESS